MIRKIFLGGILVLGLAGCGGGSTGRVEGRWVGPVVPEGPAATAAAGNELCAGPTRGELNIAGQRFEFAPNEGVQIIDGDVTPGGELRGVMTTIGMNHQSYTLRFTGSMQNGQVTGVLVTPRCRANVVLSRVGNRGLEFMRKF
jgi:hypothetical protein